MSTAYGSQSVSWLRHDLEELRGEWVWFAVLGVALVVLGFVALGSLVAASLATVIFIGALLLAGGLVEAVGAFRYRIWNGFFLHLLCGVLSAVVGLLFLAAPADALFPLTLLLACMLLVGGIFSMLGAASYRFPGWGWKLAGGVIDVVLGVMIWQAWPAAALWVIGLFVGINLIFRGITWLSVGLAVRSIPRPATA